MTYKTSQMLLHGTLHSVSGKDNKDTSIAPTSFETKLRGTSRQKGCSISRVNKYTSHLHASVEADVSSTIIILGIRPLLSKQEHSPAKLVNNC